MPVPTYDQFIESLLRLLGENPSGIDTVRAYEALAERAGLTREDRLEMLPSGRQAVFKNRIGWAQDRLKRAGYSHSPKRGTWQLTEDGRTFAKRHPIPLTPDQVLEIADVDRESSTASGPSQPAAAKPGTIPPTAAAQASPDDRIESALRELNESVGRDLLERILQSSPAFFERMVLELLHKMGYGATPDALQHVGGTGDGGIDGIISLDRLGLDRVYEAPRRQGARFQLHASRGYPSAHRNGACSLRQDERLNHHGEGALTASSASRSHRDGSPSSGPKLSSIRHKVSTRAGRSAHA